MEGQKKSRARGRSVRLPAITAGAYIWRAFVELGMAEAGLTLAPLSWAEIRAAAWASDGEIGPWEARLLRRMSSAYVGGRQVGRDPFAIPPWDGRG